MIEISAPGLSRDASPLPEALSGCSVLPVELSGAGPAGVKAPDRQKRGCRSSFSRLSVANRTAALCTLTPDRKGILLQAMTSCRETAENSIRRSGEWNQKPSECLED